ncbi:hypothetical protein KCV87_06760 [Actinosynnema pretiosum subsp. pretiosum]|uniref:Uncharacterized protein n=2 Tax=Actinosynnema TaxID=40566 RepID=C6WMR2_ACTMD|nr:hypothetical protein [Actinosynnema mirum]ACU36591.1 hypothetical protein Amir_2656 [Actinosynnema mirum DSM 43827]AXX30042.1 hypothetical protein APASM_2677 [Actinosynnema pretiosum subsp. pretiosum]QUF05780.1 hypothetical protein KCV87_06760 [Actinosynnema pretiosum subsp. pretiosum]
MTQHLTRFTSVAPEYRHYPKEVVPLPDHDLVLPDAHLKWYEVRKSDATVPDALRAEAHEFLLARVADRDLDLSGDLGFVVHHLCGEAFHFLIACTWRNNNEMWLSVYARDAARQDSFERVEQGRHLQVVCVWEMGAVLHEQRAWIEYLKSPRDEAATRAYLDDRFAGAV